MFKSSFCDYSGAHILGKGTIAITGKKRSKDASRKTNSKRSR